MIPKFIELTSYENGVSVAWDTEDYYYDGSGCFNTSMYKFADEIPY